jgi:ribosomal protein L7/L12
MPAAYQAADLQRIFGQMNDRFRALEEQMARVSAAAGVPYTPPSATAPADVVDLARAGKSMDAIRRYRELTNASFEDARAVVAGL